LIGVRTTLLLAIGVLAACNGSGSSATHGAGEDAGIDGSVHDASVGDTSTPESGAEAAAPDGCTLEVFDAGAFLPSTDDAGALIGTPCLPSAENSVTFDGFDYHEVNLPTTVPSGQPTCIVNHFQGLVTCPYGQSATGQPPPCASPCTTPTGQPVTGRVLPQCVDRLASKVVLWSCRCANAEGRTDDGDAYCKCPSGTACTQLVTSLGAAEDDYSGAYCLPSASLFDAGAGCLVTCNPETAPCPQ
jgi:hypothetical protein